MFVYRSTDRTDSCRRTGRVCSAIMPRSPHSRECYRAARPAGGRSSGRLRRPLRRVQRFRSGDPGSIPPARCWRAISLWRSRRRSVIYIFVVLEVGTRRILHWNVTDRRCESVGRHHQHAEGLVCVLARRTGGPLVVQVGAGPYSNARGRGYSETQPPLCAVSRSMTPSPLSRRPSGVSFSE